MKSKHIALGVVVFIVLFASLVSCREKPATDKVPEIVAPTTSPGKPTVIPHSGIVALDEAVDALGRTFYLVRREEQIDEIRSRPALWILKGGPTNYFYIRGLDVRFYDGTSAPSLFSPLGEL